MGGDRFLLTILIKLENQSGSISSVLTIIQQKFYGFTKNTFYNFRIFPAFLLILDAHYFVISILWFCIGIC